MELTFFTPSRISHIVLPSVPGIRSPMVNGKETPVDCNAAEAMFLKKSMASKLASGVVGGISLRAGSYCLGRLGLVVATTFLFIMISLLLDFDDGSLLPITVASDAEADISTVYLREHGMNVRVP